MYLIIDSLAVRMEQGLKLRDHQVDARLQLRQTIANVMHQQLCNHMRNVSGKVNGGHGQSTNAIECLGQVSGTVARSDARVLSLEEQRFILDRVIHGLAVVNVLL